MVARRAADGHRAGDAHGPALQRIVSQNLATDEMVLALVPASQILAVSHFADDERISNVTREAAGIRERVSGDGETMVAMRPDVVLTDPFARRDTQMLLRQVDIPVLQFPSADSFDAIRDNLKTMGEDLGAVPQAAAVIAKLDADLAALETRVGHGPRPKALFYNDGYTAGAGTLIDDMLRVAGLSNAASDYGIGGHAPVSLEQVFAMDPDVIIVSDYGADARARALIDTPTALTHPAWRAVRAVSAHRVYVVPARYTLSTSQYAVRGAEALARVIHPEAFAAPATGITQ